MQKRLDKNKRAPACGKADEEYLLTTKLFCGKCGALMFGESGTSATGRTYYYYKCANVKRRKGCNKKTVQKQVERKRQLQSAKGVRSQSPEKKSGFRL